ncbi:MAG: thioesterase family protein [Caulobacterales bacterium]
MSEDIGIEVWRGGVAPWECDDMGHMNVRFYVARQMEGLVGLAAALGMPSAFAANAEATLVLRDQHIRFLREAPSRAPLHMVGGVVEMGESEARLLQLLVHSGSGEVAAGFQSIVAHVTARDGRAFPWSERTRTLAAGLMVVVPEAVRPRTLSLDPVEITASLAEAERMDLVRLGAGAIGAPDIDVFGRMRAEHVIGRVSDGVSRLANPFRHSVSVAEDGKVVRVGGAVLEYRIVYVAWPRAGDRFEIRSGVASFDERSQHMAHWMLDPASGRPWASAMAVAVNFDLDARKLIPVTPHAAADLTTRLKPGLAL